ncbi:NADH dehydrogenase FAD-containing subunit [Ectopseudomonas oleovorans]|uniref:NADH dehydrogenase FAD-containing subunit n=2 Tax=Pseudomonadaceae TaxID=135621 RepID=A0A397NEK7_ECTOL|nr:MULTISPECIES: FAD-dependent oxidoreductase [Pseudomonas]QMV65919.1 FAD-dependent oxidoreductase [Pseudomonas berkeleyensis]RIA35920.1 NADH dehydrogenase FAD-containing subunit [Pseudomonas oleovorans]WSO41409.1 FAD-dependent oxidoreductase [Pseudomonas berkeleyensis]
MKQQILIIGAGFGGMWSALSATRLLDKQQRLDVAVTLLAPQAELRVRPRFYESDLATTVAPLGPLFEAVGVQFIQGSATRIDAAGKRVIYRNAAGAQAELHFDRLILASGSQVARPPLAGIDRFAFDVDSLESAQRLEAHLQSLSERPNSLARNTVVVVGGGFTGIETATEMPARLRAILGDKADIRVIVVDMGKRVGSAMGEQIANVIAEASDTLGVTWRLGSPVSMVDEHGVMLDDGERIEASTVVWTVGVKASPLTQQIDGERDAFGRLHVDRNLKVLGQEAIYATGDTAYAAVDDQGNHALMTCQHAIALGRSAGNNAAADLLGVEPTPYSQPKYVTCLDLGGWGAVFTEGWERKVVLTGQEGKALKTEINTKWIYPPEANRETALAAADPLIPVVA